MLFLYSHDCCQEVFAQVANSALTFVICHSGVMPNPTVIPASNTAQLKESEISSLTQVAMQAISGEIVSENSWKLSVENLPAFSTKSMRRMGLLLTARFINSQSYV